MGDGRREVWPSVRVEILGDIGREDDVDEAFMVVVVHKRDLRIVEERRVVEVEQGRLGEVQPHWGIS